MWAGLLRALGLREGRQGPGLPGRRKKEGARGLEPRMGLREEGRGSGKLSQKGEGRCRDAGV